MGVICSCVFIHVLHSELGSSSLSLSLPLKMDGLGTLQEICPLTLSRRFKFMSPRFRYTDSIVARKNKERGKITDLQ